MNSQSYHDGTLTIDGQTLTIRRYYFPWLGPKHVALDSVRGVQRHAAVAVRRQRAGMGLHHHEVLGQP